MHENNHYLQSALVRNWSNVNASGRHDGHVWIYDFVAKSLNRAHCDRSFCRTGLFTPEQEKLFNRRVEAPLIQFRDQALKRFRANPHAALPELRAPVARAIAFWRLMNGSRFDAALARDRNESSNGFVDVFSELRDEDWPALAANMEAHRDIAVYFVPQRFVCLPETGSFMMPLSRPGKPLCAAEVFPLDPHLALVVQPRGFELTARDIDGLMLWSVGQGVSRSVVVPRFLVEAAGENEAVDLIHDMRKRTESIVFQLNEAAADLGLLTERMRDPGWPT